MIPDETERTLLMIALCAVWLLTFVGLWYRGRRGN